MATSRARIQQAADRLHRAARSRRPVEPVRDLLDEGDLDAAYTVQTLNVRRAIDAGQRLVGCKIGLTSAAVQRQLGVDQPDFGMLLSGMRYDDGAVVPHDAVLQARIEAEIALVLRADLDLAAPTEADLLAATDHARAALEIVGSRIAGWDITIIDTIADNASSGAFVLGPEGYPVTGLDLPAVGMTMWRDGQVVSTGTGADCLGSPLTAARWLAGALHRYGQPLRRGDVVLTGALGPMVPVGPGDTFEAELTGLGRVRAAFSPHHATVGRSA
jgi:2-keto-4-pentenoate hydratase